MNLILNLFSFLFVSYSVRNVAADVTPLDFAELGFNVLSSFDNPAAIFQAFSTFVSSMTSDGDTNQKTLNEIQGTLTSMNNKLDSITENLQTFKDEIITKLKELQTNKEITERLDKFFTFGQTINRYFHRFQQVSKKNRTEDDLIRFIDTVRSASDNVGVRSILDQMLTALTGDTWTSGGLEVLSDVTIVSSLVCSRGRSQQLIINNLYKPLWVAELKGLAMDLFTINEIRKMKHLDMNSTLDDTKDDFIKRSNKAVKYLKDAMSKSSREVWSCTSNNPQQGVTYEKFRSFMYKIIHNEVDLNRPGEGVVLFPCKGDCTRFYYDATIGCTPWSKHSDCTGYKNMCPGKMYYCSNFDSNSQICHSKDNRLVEDESNHYEYIEGDNGQIYGKKKQGGCNGRLTYHNVVTYLYQCDICVCTCVPTNPKNTYIDLRTVTADVKENKVVVGLRLKKIDDVFHLEIQQGKLLPSGSIDPKTISWKSNPKTNDKGYYHKFSLEDRSVLLDDVEFDSTFVITGVKFAHHHGLLRLDAQGHRFDYKQGKLIVGYYDWHYFEGWTRDLREYDIKDYDLPTNHLNNWFHTVPRQYVKMTISSMKSDVGQSIVPFVDIEPVTSKQPTPLSGVGLFHKSYKNESAGYLALKILTYDYTPHVKFNA